MSKRREQYLNLEIGLPDLAYGLMAEYDADPHPNRISLIAGAYRDQDGLPWVLPSVKEVSDRLFAMKPRLCQEQH